MSEFGDLLRETRDARGLTLREAERATRISGTHLAALEAEQFGQLPPAAYARGIVRNYAQFLGLDPSEVLARFESASGARVEPVGVVPATSPLDASTHWAPNFAIIAFMVVMSAVVFAWMYSAYFQGSTTLATSTVGIPTVTPVSASILSTTLPQSTVAPVSQAEASATASPTASATPSPTPQPPPAPTEAAPAIVASDPVEESGATPEAELVVTEQVVETENHQAVSEETVETGVDDEVESPGAHTFGIWAVDEVWVQVFVDGELALEETLPEGAERIFEGDSVEVSSGNSSSLRIYVDGEEYVAGETWDSTFTYP